MVKEERTGRLCGSSGKERPVRRLNTQGASVVSPARSSVVAPAAFIPSALVPRLVQLGAFLNAANQFVLLAINELQIIVGQLRQFLFQSAPGDVPISFGDE
jgi:hypothetical protein